VKEVLIKEVPPFYLFFNHNKTKRLLSNLCTVTVQPTGLAVLGFTNQTIRQIVHPHITGSQLRIRLTNKYGTTPLTLGEVHVAYAGQGASIIPDSDRIVNFSGNTSVTIPVGTDVVSDPISLDVVEGKNLAISIYVPYSSGPTTFHHLSKQTVYISTFGNKAGEGTGTSFVPAQIESWYWLTGVDVIAPHNTKGTIVCFGDSITDGEKSTRNANHRYPDLLANRLHDAGIAKSVLNAGIAGNQILSDGSSVSALARFDQDVLIQPGVTDVILLEGINDIGFSNKNAEDIALGMKQLITRAHNRGLRIYGGTLLPFQGASNYTEEKEQTREKVNDWIRTSGAFDGVIDFEKALQDPENPEKLMPSYNSGDNLHPNDAGYQVMADTINLSLLR